MRRGSSGAQSQLQISRDKQGTIAAAAAWIADRIAASAGPFRTALSGGKTPRPLYETLASKPFRQQIDWQRLELFWGDERFVSHTDPRSNYRMVRESLLSHAPILPAHIHPIDTEGDVRAAAQRYDALLKSTYGADVFSQSRPMFDLVLLGLGTDGHTASLFPGSPVLDEIVSWAAPVLDQSEPRITLTNPALMSRRSALFLVTGEDKANAVRRVIAGDPTLPATQISGSGDVVWFLDKSAATFLGGTVAS